MRKPASMQNLREKALNKKAPDVKFLLRLVYSKDQK